MERTRRIKARVAESAIKKSKVFTKPKLNAYCTRSHNKSVTAISEKSTNKPSRSLQNHCRSTKMTKQSDMLEPLVKKSVPTRAEPTRVLRPSNRNASSRSGLAPSGRLKKSQTPSSSTPLKLCKSMSSNLSAAQSTPVNQRERHCDLISSLSPILCSSATPNLKERSSKSPFDQISEDKSHKELYASLNCTSPLKLPEPKVSRSLCQSFEQLEQMHQKQTSGTDICHFLHSSSVDDANQELDPYKLFNLEENEPSFEESVKCDDDPGTKVTISEKPSTKLLRVPRKKRVNYAEWDSIEDRVPKPCYSEEQLKLIQKMNAEFDEISKLDFLVE